MADTNHGHFGAHGDHEKRDISLRGVVIFAVGLAILCVLSGAAALAVFRYLDNRLVQAETPVSPVNLPAGQLPPEPRLLTDEPSNLATYRREQDDRLLTYGWVDKQSGVVRIPIERAKELILQRGLPTR
jgi:hypothetical protein